MITNNCSLTLHILEFTFLYLFSYINHKHWNINLYRWNVQISITKPFWHLKIQFFFFYIKCFWEILNNDYICQFHNIIITWNIYHFRKQIYYNNIWCKYKKIYSCSGHIQTFNIVNFGSFLIHFKKLNLKETLYSMIINNDFNIEMFIKTQHNEVNFNKLINHYTTKF